MEARNRSTWGGLFLALCSFLASCSTAPGDMPLEKRLMSNDRELREAALGELDLLTGASKSETVDFLIARLRERKAPRDTYAAEALGRLKSDARAAIGDLLEAFRSPDHSLSSNAIWALGQIGAEAVPAVATLLEDPDPEVRAIAVLGLEKIEEGAIPHLVQALKDEDIYVRLYAIGALEEIQDKSALPALRRVKKEDPEEMVRTRAAEALEVLVK